MLADCDVYAGDLNADSHGRNSLVSCAAKCISNFQYFKTCACCKYDVQTDRQRDGRMDSLYDSKLLHFIVLHAQLGQSNLV